MESVYERALCYELRGLGYDVRNQVGIKMKYNNLAFEEGFRLDILVNDLVIVEIKSTEGLQDVHFKQVLTYLKLADKRLGLLINFNAASLKKSIRRIVNNL